MERKADINERTLNFYGKKFNELVANYEILEEALTQIDEKAFAEMLNFEKNHPKVTRVGYLDGAKIPDGVLEYDISALDMGILDEERDVFNGCYKKGYITGLETLTPEEKAQYLSLLERAVSSAKKWKELDSQFQALNEKSEFYRKLYDIANQGYIKGVVSEQKAKQLLTIYDSANPFLQELNRLTACKRALWLKASRTEEEEILLKQYTTQIGQLEIASMQWSISDADEEIIQQLKREGLNINLETNSNYNDSNFSNTTKLNLAYNSDNWMTELNLSNTLNVDSKGKVSDLYLINSQFMYYREKFSFMSNSTYNKQAENDSFNQTFTATYDDFTASLSEDIVTSEMQNSEGSKFDITTYTTNANFSYNKDKLSINVNGSITPNKKEISTDEFGKQTFERDTEWSTSAGVTYQTGAFSNGANVNISSEGETYSLSSRANFQPLSGNTSITITPSLVASYNDNENAEMYTLNSGLNVNTSYRQKGFSASLNLNENYSTTMSHGNKPNLNHNFGANLNLSFKENFGLGLKVNDSDSRTSHSTVCGISASYQNDKIGNLTLEYNHTESKDKFARKNKGIDYIGLNYSVPLYREKKSPKNQQNY